MTADKYWFTQLEEEAERRSGQSSFHAFAEGQHSDVRGEIRNFDNGSELNLPHDGWPNHLFILIGIHGSLEALVDATSVPLRAQSQLVILPGTPCKLIARSRSAIELISLRSSLSRP
jgi:hypothetical protein